MSKQRAQYEVIDLVDAPKEKSEVRIGLNFTAEHPQSNGAVYYTDNTGTEWTFWVGDTCKLVTLL